MPIAAIFLHSFYIIISYLRRGALCHGPTFLDPLQKSKTYLKKRPIFLDIATVLGQKLTKLRQI